MTSPSLQIVTDGSVRIGVRRESNAARCDSKGTEAGAMRVREAGTPEIGADGTAQTRIACLPDTRDGGFMRTLGMRIFERSRRE
jgi:hypothetical protein